MAWGASEWVAVVSAVLALASLVLNWAVVRRQTQLQFESLKAQMDAEVLAWAHDAINLVSQAEDAVDPRRRGHMLRRLALGRTDDKKSAFAVAAELGEAISCAQGRSVG